MDTQFYCKNPERRTLVKEHPTLNGIDYLEVWDSQAPTGSPRQRTLLVHCFKKISGLTRDNVLITGGVRVTPIKVLWAYPATGIPAPPAPNAVINKAESKLLGQLPDRDNVLVVRTDAAGDYSTYTLKLVKSASDDSPPADFDLLLSQVDFLFKVECPSDFDCKSSQVCPEEKLLAPSINYLAKDYESFRQLILDRLAVTMPNWQERNPADLGIALVELLAYAADHLSYYQDAVATEAYLGTARSRVSLRRHARLLDYQINEGANARVWVCFEVAQGSSADGFTLPAGTVLLTRINDSRVELPSSMLDAALGAGAQVFETLEDVTLRGTPHPLGFYPWQDEQCCLPGGATSATLEGSAADLALHQGDVLILEEVLGPASGQPEDADPTHRQAVRLNAPPLELTDPLNGNKVLQITWGAQDALTFPLCISSVVGQKTYPNVSVARRNVALADHGRRVSGEDLPAIPDTGTYRPQLRFGPVSQQGRTLDVQNRVVLFDPAAPAATAFQWDSQLVLPAVQLTGDGEVWTPQLDLLSSSASSPDFVVETENDGTASLRFGDGVLGRAPASGTQLAAAYRVGNGTAGNVGAESIAHVLSAPAGITKVRNPLPASGGADPESLEAVRLYAPQAFRTQQRAVTEADYAEVALRHPEIQKAVARIRWTGSWYTVFVTVDRKGSETLDAAFKLEMLQYFDQFRLAGYDLEIQAPIYVPLDIAMTVCVDPDYFASDVEQALLGAFSNRELPDGTRGFFYPDNFTFGQPVYLSKVVATAMQVPGVHWVDMDDTPPKPNLFQRFGQPSRGEVAAGQISMDQLEVARLDNDPNAPENGRLRFFMEGGM